MDVVDEIEEIKLYDVEVRHIITIPGYRIRVLIFIDKDANTYHWTTTLSPISPSFEEGEICNIQAKCNRSRNNKLNWVKKIVTPHKDIRSVKSEQPDAEDVLLGLADY